MFKSSIHTGPFDAKAGTKSETKNGISSESGTFEERVMKLTSIKSAP